MNHRSRARKSSGWDITSDIFVFEDPARIYKILNGLFGIILVGSVAIALASLVVSWQTAFRLSVISTLSFTAIIFIHRAGRPREASLLALFTITAVSLVGIVLGDGIHDTAIVLLPIVIALGSLVLSRALFYGMTVGILTAILAIGSLEYQGFIINKYSGQWTPADIAILLLVTLGGAVVMRQLTLVIHESLMRAYASERSYREIFNASGDAIFIHDAETGAILDVNDRMLEIFGFSREELDATAFDLTLSGDPGFRAEDAHARIQKTIEEGPQIFEWLARRRSGEKFWCEVSLRRAQIGGEDRILAMVRDIDDRKRMQEQLRQAEKLQAVGTLAGGVAHDFNNQLTGIIGWTDLLREQVAGNPEWDTATANILTSAKRASDLTAQLLAFARKGKFESKPVDLHTLIKEVVQLLAHTIDKRIVLETRLEAAVPFTVGDPSQLQNALLNLGLNARDAMPDGGTLVFATRNLEITPDQEICPRWNLVPGSYVEVAVTDTGIGMDQETIGSIFEPFFTTKQETKGTGLGLAAVYGTINSHQGCIDVTSAEGAGTTFKIGLPLGPKPREAIPVDESPREIQTGRILVIDDEEILIQTVAAILRREGYDVATATDPREGLEMFRRSPAEFDLVLLDMIMPGLSGPQVFRGLREIDTRASVLIMSGATANHEVQILADAGARGFLAKPFRPRDLARAVAEALPSRTGS